jgi:hypothetical protein
MSYLKKAAPALLLGVVSLALVAASAHRPFAASPFAEAGVPVGADTSKLLHAYVVMQAGDCNSNLEFLHVFDRPGLKERYGLSGLVVESSASDARAILAEKQIALPVKEMSARMAAHSKLLGYPKTPFLVVINRGGMIRFAAPAPRDDASQDLLVGALEALAKLPPATRPAS